MEWDTVKHVVVVVQQDPKKKKGKKKLLLVHACKTQGSTVCGGGGDLSELFSLSLQILKDFKKNSCYCASLPSSYIPIFPPPPLTPLNYITINQNSEPTSFTHSFRIIYTNILISLCSSFLYVPPPTPPPRLAGISWNFRRYGTQRNGVSSKWKPHQLDVWWI